MGILAQQNAFTLAEVLIALVVIGIVAAITLTTVMPNIQERVNSQRQANIVYKVTQATNLMKANGAMINGFESTDAFVDELQKYLKIMKRCDSDHIADCWPTKTVTNSLGSPYSVSRAKTGEDLGFKERKTKNTSIVLADGASLIMTYNPEQVGLSPGDKLISKNKELPVGRGYKEFLEYTTNSTAGLAFVMDVNGSKGPNSETIGTKMHDIRNLNGAKFAGCAGKKYNNKCYTEIDSYSPLDCTRNTDNSLTHPENFDYCGSSGGSATDYWAGAQKVCKDLDSQLPPPASLWNIVGAGDTNKRNIGAFGCFWSSHLDSMNPNRPMYLCIGGSVQNPNGGGSSNYAYGRSDMKKVLCID